MNGKQLANNYKEEEIEFAIIINNYYPDYDGIEKTKRMFFIYQRDNKIIDKTCANCGVLFVYVPATKQFYPASKAYSFSNHYYSRKYDNGNYMEYYIASSIENAKSIVDYIYLLG